MLKVEYFNKGNHYLYELLEDVQHFLEDHEHTFGVTIQDVTLYRENDEFWCARVYYYEDERK